MVEKVEFELLLEEGDEGIERIWEEEGELDAGMGLIEAFTLACASN